MTFTSIDQIVRRVLLEKRLPIHYYLEFLTHACSCIRELSFDTLRIVNTVTLQHNSYYACDLPCDFVDWTKVGIKQGQFIQPITQRESINNLNNYTTTGEVIPYGGTNTVNMDFPFWPGYWMFQNVDDLGENLGRLYGYNTGIANDGFKIIWNRGQIQLTESFDTCVIVLEYISDGQTVDNASQVDPYAQAAIESYINWKRSPNADIDRSPEGVSFVNQRRILRARKDELTPWDIRQIMYRNYKGSIKN